MTAIIIAAAIEKFLRSRNSPISDPELSDPLILGSPGAGAQQAVPDGNGQQDSEETD